MTSKEIYTALLKSTVPQLEELADKLAGNPLVDLLTRMGVGMGEVVALIVDGDIYFAMTPKGIVLMREPTPLSIKLTPERAQAMMAADNVMVWFFKEVIA